MSPSPGSGQTRGDVQDALAQCFGLGDGEVTVKGE
jgi:hypothetical protein